MIIDKLKIAILGVLLACGSAIQAQQLQLGQSTFKGVKTDTKNVEGFYGVRYAQPPVGDLRWQAPQTISYAAEQYDATKFGAACMQTDYTTVWYRDILAAFKGDQALAATPTGISEDCLYLNIWRPTTVQKPLPIMVFVHGGNNLGGWGYEPNYLGDKLASKGVVVISINYRMGVFGFFSHPKLKGKGAGNQGLLDIVESLKWVQKHAASFGGDANNVTLFGESAGAANIGHLSISPLTKGLFHKAIRQSGAFEIDYNDTLVEDQGYGEGYLNELGVASIEDAKSLPASTLLDSFNAYYRGEKSTANQQNFYGVQDDYLLPSIGPSAYKNSHISHLMIGFNGDESLMYVPEVTEQQLAMGLQQYTNGPELKAFVAHAGARHGNAKASAREQAALIQDGVHFACPSLVTADLFQAKGVQTYLYLFDRQRKGAGGKVLGAYHGAELPYVFNQHDSWITTGKQDLALSERMLTMWSNFAKGQAPAPNWPSVASAHKGMRLAATDSAGIAPFDKLCKLLDASAGTP